MLSEVPREAYMTAMRFCIAHSEAYADLNIDEEAAKKHFQQLVPECIRAQATRVEAEGSFPPGLSGPASANGADVSLQEVVVADNDVPMVPEEEACARAHFAGESEVDERAEPMADLQFAACDLSTADLDVERSTHECSERLERLYSLLMTRKNASARDGDDA